MLSHLSIRDIVLIEKLEIDFGAGLSVLTGETGTEVDLQLLDQDDVTDRQVRQQAGWCSRIRDQRPIGLELDTLRSSSRKVAGFFGIARQDAPMSLPACESHEPAFSRGSRPPLCSKA